MALAIVEADRLDPVETLQRPGEAGGRILPAGKQNERALLVHRFIPTRPPALYDRQRSASSISVKAGLGWWRLG